MSRSAGLFIAQRIGYSVAVLLGVLVVVFVIGHAIGDPARLMLPPEAPTAEYLALRQRLDLDQPILEQFVAVAGGWLHGDFGDSLWQRQPALQIVLAALPATVTLALASLAIVAPVAIGLGLITAMRSGSRLDFGVRAFAVAAVSMPEAWFGLMLILLFAVQLHVVPTSGFDTPTSLILPALTLALRPLGRIIPITRASVLLELEKPYALATRARGVSSAGLGFRALRNAAIPVLTMLGLEAASLFQGAIVVEFIFAWPGLGSLFIQAVGRRDLPLIEAAALIMAIVVIAANLLVDLSYSLVDPRLRAS